MLNTCLSSYDDLRHETEHVHVPMEGRRVFLPLWLFLRRQLRDPCALVNAARDLKQYAEVCFWY